MLEEALAYSLVIGCSIFGIGWGIVNTFLVSLFTMWPARLINLFLGKYRLEE